MKTLIIASRKGGSGKSTVTVNLAVAAVQAKLATVLVDMDEQGSTTDWWNCRESEAPGLLQATLKELPAKLAALAQAGVDIVIIDTPPTVTKELREVIKFADLVLIPVQPSPNDLRALGGTIDIVNEEGKSFAFCVTRAKTVSKLTSKTIAALSAYGQVAPSIIGDRVAFVDAMATGDAIIEAAPKDKGTQEVLELFAFVWKNIQKKNTRKV